MTVLLLVHVLQLSSPLGTIVCYFNTLNFDIHAQFIYRTVGEHCCEVAMHQHGCCVLIMLS